MQENDRAYHNTEVEVIPPISKVVLAQCSQLDNCFQNEDASETIVNNVKGIYSLFTDCRPFQSQGNCIEHNDTSYEIVKDLTELLLLLHFLTDQDRK